MHVRLLLSTGGTVSLGGNLLANWRHKSSICAQEIDLSARWPRRNGESCILFELSKVSEARIREQQQEQSQRQQFRPFQSNLESLAWSETRRVSRAIGACFRLPRISFVCSAGSGGGAAGRGLRLDWSATELASSEGLALARALRNLAGEQARQWARPQPSSPARLLARRRRRQSNGWPRSNLFAHLFGQRSEEHSTGHLLESIMRRVKNGREITSNCFSRSELWRARPPTAGTSAVPAWWRRLASPSRFSVLRSSGSTEAAPAEPLQLVFVFPEKS